MGRRLRVQIFDPLSLSTLATHRRYAPGRTLLCCQFIASLSLWHVLLFICVCVYRLPVHFFDATDVTLELIASSQYSVSPALFFLSPPRRLCLHLR